MVSFLSNKHIFVVKLQQVLVAGHPLSSVIVEYSEDRRICYIIVQKRTTVLLNTHLFKENQEWKHILFHELISLYCLFNQLV